MDKGTLDEFIRFEADDVRVVGPETWSIVCHGVVMHVFVNEAKDRMRVVAPVSAASELADEQLRGALAGSFHGDGRYGLHEDQLYSVFLHRLSSLTETDLRSGLRQVARLFKTFGASYTSGRMRFEWPRPAPLGPERGGARRRTEEVIRARLELPQPVLDGDALRRGDGDDADDAGRVDGAEPVGGDEESAVDSG